MQEYVRFSRNRRVHNVIAYIVDTASAALLLIFLIILFFSYIFCAAVVEGTSMVPTLQEQDMLLVSLLDRDMKTGDIVVIDVEGATLLDAQQEPYEVPGLTNCIVKRVIGTGGQTLKIDFTTGTVFLDGAALDEPYVSGMTSDPLDRGAFTYPITIPEGYLFVMGDNRTISMDSRYSEIGLIPESAVKGKAIMRTYPYSSFGLIN